MRLAILLAIFAAGTFAAEAFGQTVSITGFADPDTGQASQWNGTWQLGTPVTIGPTRHYTVHHPNRNVEPQFLTFTDTGGRWSAGPRDNPHTPHEPSNVRLVHYSTVWELGIKRFIRPSKIGHPFFLFQ